MSKYILCALLIFAGSLSTNLFGQHSLEKTLNDYLEGGTHRNRERVSLAFHPSATMQFVKDGSLVTIPITDYLANIKPGPKQNRTTKIEYADIHGNTANAKVISQYEDFRFVDHFNLLLIDDQWKIVNKIFHKELKSVVTEETYRREIQRVFDKWDKAYKERRYELLEEVLHEDWHYAGGSDGNITNKKKAIADFQSSDYTFKDIVFNDIEFRFHGLTAIVTGREQLITQEKNGGQNEFRLRFTDVYVKENGIWQAVATHSSPIE